jgi:hypothetical protein
MSENRIRRLNDAKITPPLYGTLSHVIAINILTSFFLIIQFKKQFLIF